VFNTFTKTDYELFLSKLKTNGGQPKAHEPVGFVSITLQDDDTVVSLDFPRDGRFVLLKLLRAMTGLSFAVSIILSRFK